MRALMFAVVSLVSLGASAQVSVAGNWTISMIETDAGTCFSTPGKETTQSWLISTTPDGKVEVVVTGDKLFKGLGGTLQGDTLVLKAYGKVRGGNDATWIKVKIDGNKVIGIRRHLSVQPQQFLKSKATAPCFLDFDLSGTRSG